VYAAIGLVYRNCNFLCTRPAWCCSVIQIEVQLGHLTVACKSLPPDLLLQLLCNDVTSGKLNYHMSCFLPACWHPIAVSLIS